MKNFIYSVIILALLSFGVILQAQAEQTAEEKVRELIKIMQQAKIEKKFNVDFLRDLKELQLLATIRKEAREKGERLTTKEEVERLKQIKNYAEKEQNKRINQILIKNVEMSEQLLKLRKVGYKAIEEQKKITERMLRIQVELIEQLYEVSSCMLVRDIAGAELDDLLYAKAKKIIR